MNDGASEQRQVATKVECAGVRRTEHGIIYRMRLSAFRDDSIVAGNAVNEGPQFHQELRRETGARSRLHFGPIHTERRVESRRQLLVSARREESYICDGVHFCSPVW